MVLGIFFYSVYRGFSHERHGKIGKDRIRERKKEADFEKAKAESQWPKAGGRKREDLRSEEERKVRASAEARIIYFT